MKRNKQLNFWFRNGVVICMVLMYVCLQSTTTLAFTTSPSIRNLPVHKADSKVPNHAHQSFSLNGRSYNPRSHQLSTQLCSSSSPDSHEGEQMKVTRRYRVASILYFITFACLWVSPNRMIDASMSMGTMIGGACGYAIASGVYNVLHNENNEGLQGCNLGLIWFALVGLFAFPGEAYFHSSLPGALRLSALMTISKLYGLYASILGFKQSKQLALWKQDVQKTWTGLWQLKDKSATMYRNQLYAILLLGVVNHSLEAINSIQVSELSVKSRPQIIIIIIIIQKINILTPFLFSFCTVSQRGQSPFLISLSMSAIARLGLISSMIYSLKEAAEQQRLTELPYIKFNLLLSAWTIAGTFHFISCKLQTTLGFFLSDRRIQRFHHLTNFKIVN